MFRYIFSSLNKIYLDREPIYEVLDSQPSILTITPVIML